MTRRDRSEIELFHHKHACRFFQFPCDKATPAAIYSRWTTGFRRSGFPPRSFPPATLFLNMDNIPSAVSQHRFHLESSFDTTNQPVSSLEAKRGTHISSRPPPHLLDDHVTTGYHLHAEFNSDDEDFDMYSRPLPSKKPYVLPVPEEAERLALFMEQGVDTGAFPTPDDIEHIRITDDTGGVRYVSSVRVYHSLCLITDTRLGRSNGRMGEEPRSLLRGVHASRRPWCYV